MSPFFRSRRLLMSIFWSWGFGSGMIALRLPGSTARVVTRILVRKPLRDLDLLVWRLYQEDRTSSRDAMWLAHLGRHANTPVDRIEAHHLSVPSCRLWLKAAAWHHVQPTAEVWSLSTWPWKQMESPHGRCSRRRTKGSVSITGPSWRQKMGLHRENASGWAFV